MSNKAHLHWETVSPQLKQALALIQQHEVFSNFRLVGGTALSLLYGHRISTDIDLFSTVSYPDFKPGDCLDALNELFQVVQLVSPLPLTNGGSIFIGNNTDNLIKLDLWHEEPFMRDEQVIDSVRIAHPDDLVAMKCNVSVIQPRKKDVWDLHLLSSHYTFHEAEALYLERYPYSSDTQQLRTNLKNMDQVGDDFDPICLLGKEWPLVMYDIHLWING
jgi:hypothetical protein